MTTVIAVEDMSCEGCEEIVENALTDVRGVESAEADHDAGTATVEGDADTDALVDAVDIAGYEAAVESGAGDADEDAGADGADDGADAAEDAETADADEADEADEDADDTDEADD